MKATRMRILGIAATAAAVLCVGAGSIALAAPIISGITATGIGTSDATVSWSTDSTTSGQVMYGTTTSYGLTSSTTASSTLHVVALGGLEAGTTYHFQIEATDASTTATSSDQTFTTLAASTTPVISGLTVSGAGTSSATVTWTTNVPATTQLNYGTTTSYGSSSTLDTSLTTNHTVSLSGLESATIYHIQASSGNSAGTSTATTTFMTSVATTSTPLAITGIDSVDTSAIADNLYEDGWKWVIHFTVPEGEDAFRIRFSDWGNASTSFPAAGNIRLTSSQSSNATTSSSGITATGNGYSEWFYLTGDTSTTTAGRQIDLVVEVKVPFGTPAGSYSSNFTAQTYPSTATSTATSTP